MLQLSNSALRFIIPLLRHVLLSGVTLYIPKHHQVSYPQGIAVE